MGSSVSSIKTATALYTIGEMTPLIFQGLRGFGQGIASQHDEYNLQTGFLCSRLNTRNT